VLVVGEWETSVLEFFQSGCSRLPKNFVSPSKTQYEIPDLVQNLDVFPFPERDDTPIDFYNETSCFGKNVVMVSSRGCRLRCSFCNVECIYGRHTYRTRSAKNVVDEMVYLRDKYAFDEISLHWILFRQNRRLAHEEEKDLGSYVLRFVQVTDDRLWKGASLIRVLIGAILDT